MKVLCLGNNTELTDQMTTELAEQNNRINYGLLSDLQSSLDIVNLSINDGYYHTSVLDINPGRILKLSNVFDFVVVLNQPVQLWNHPDEFYTTNKIALSMKVPVEWQDIQGKHQVEYWSNLVESNQSFCIFPFIELLVDNNHTKVCCRSDKSIVNINDLKDFATDKNYSLIRENMLQGTKLSEHCGLCYMSESRGIKSARQQETVEWAIRLNLNSVDDLSTITKPVYYEVRPSNVCNIMCRICQPTSSNKIEKEWKTLGWIDPDSKISYSNFDIVDTNDIKKLYVAGGEPTAMPEFYKFLQTCIDNKDTNFEFLVNTNAVKFSDKLFDLIGHFSNLQFVVSIDGYKLANDYSRWGSKWQTVITNIKKLIKNGNKVTFNVVVSLYTIFSYADLIHFLNTNFPNCLIHCQFAENVYPFIFEYSDEQIHKLETIKSTKIYSDDELFKSFVDGAIQLAKHSILDKEKLQHFFNFNDTLDISRNSCLNDSIPELENLRKLL